MEEIENPKPPESEITPVTTPAQLVPDNPIPPILVNVPDIGPAPALEPKPDPATLEVKVPALPAYQAGDGTWICPECGKSGYPARSRLIHHHIRRVHAKRAGEIEALLPPTTGGNRGRPPRSITPAATAEIVPDNGETLPPDFSDITGGDETVMAPAPAAEPVKLVDYGKMGEMTFDLGTGIFVKLFGDEWKPQSAEERAGVVDAIRAYYQSKQMPDIPPGMMLAIVVAVYAAPRISAPTTRSRLQMLWTWTKLKIFRLKPQPPKLQVIPT